MVKSIGIDKFRNPIINGKLILLQDLSKETIKGVSYR